MKFFSVIILSIFLIFTKGNAIENKIILKIDNEIITTMDILDEINYLKFINNNLNQISDEEIYQIALQSIVKFKIKKNEILKSFNSVELNNKDYLNSIINNKINNLGFKNLKDFKDNLKNNKISYKNFEERFKIDIIWNQIIYSKFSNKIIINEDELKKKLQNRKVYKNSFKLKEIVFQVQDNSELQTKYDLIKNDIEKIGFENAALKHSVSSTADNGGNLGWISEEVINKELVDELRKIDLNKITRPIRIPSGFLILKKKDVKEIEQSINMDEELKKLIDYEKNQQYSNYSNLYFNKVKKNLTINAP